VMVLPRARRCHRSSRATSPCSRRTQTMSVTRSEQTPGYLGGAQNT
jgi:hypothetical protein